jgi:hypothetical protein
MSTIVIKADTKISRLLLSIAKRLGAQTIQLRDEQFEDFALGQLMEEKKTGEKVSRDVIMGKLKRP